MFFDYYVCLASCCRRCARVIHVLILASGGVFECFLNFSVAEERPQCHLFSLHGLCIACYSLAMDYLRPCAATVSSFLPLRNILYLHSEYYFGTSRGVHHLNRCTAFHVNLGGRLVPSPCVPPHHSCSRLGAPKPLSSCPCPVKPLPCHCLVCHLAPEPIAC